MKLLRPFIEFETLRIKWTKNLTPFCAVCLAIELDVYQRCLLCCEQVINEPENITYSSFAKNSVFIRSRQ